MFRTNVLSRDARRGAATLAALVTTLTAACSDAPTSNNAHSVNLMFSTAPAGAALSSTAANDSHAGLTVSGAGGTLVITRAQLVVARAELAGSASAGCAGDDRGRDCEELKLGPMLVDLPLAEGAVSVLTTAVPAGTYSRLEAKVKAVRDGDDGAAAFLAGNPAFRGVSVRVEGTFDGQPFVYAAGEEAELDMSFDPPVTVGADGLSVTVHVDLARWFADAAGNAIDPRSASAGGPNARLVADNIARSFHAFEDENHDGHDDHGRDGGGGDDRGGDDHGSGD